MCTCIRLCHMHVYIVGKWLPNHYRYRNWRKHCSPLYQKAKSLSALVFVWMFDTQDSIRVSLLSIMQGIYMWRKTRYPSRCSHLLQSFNSVIRLNHVYIDLFGPISWVKDHIRWGKTPSTFTFPTLFDVVDGLYQSSGSRNCSLKPQCRNAPQEMRVCRWTEYPLQESYKLL